MPNNDEMMDKLHIASLITEWFDGPLLKDVDKRACEGLISALRKRLARAAPPPSGDAVGKAIIALEIATGYAALVARGIGKMPILKERAASDCEIFGDAIGALSALRALPADQPYEDAAKALAKLEYELTPWVGDDEIINEEIYEVTLSGKLINQLYAALQQRVREG